MSYLGVGCYSDCYQLLRGGLSYSSLILLVLYAQPQYLVQLLPIALSKSLSLQHIAYVTYLSRSHPRPHISSQHLSLALLLRRQQIVRPRLEAEPFATNVDAEGAGDGEEHLRDADLWTGRNFDLL